MDVAVGVVIQKAFENDMVFGGALIAAALGVLTYYVAVNTGSSEKTGAVAGFFVGVAGTAAGLVVAAAGAATVVILGTAAVVAAVAMGGFFLGRWVASKAGAPQKTADAVGSAVAGAVAGAAVGFMVGGPVGAAAGAVVGAVAGWVASWF